MTPDLFNTGGWAEADLAYRRARPSAPSGRALRYVDLFCGAGGLSLAAGKAASSIGLQSRCVFAADDDKDALAVYVANLRPDEAFAGNVAGLVSYQLDTLANPTIMATEPTLLNFDLQKLVGTVDLVVAGPPCQGHSNLNNVTRRDDVRNRLYLDAVAIGIALGAPAIVIENVLNVQQSRLPVVQHSLDLLHAAGYEAQCVAFSAVVVGVPQTRSRAFLLARKRCGRSWNEVLAAFTRPPRALEWAIADLEHLADDERTEYDRAPMIVQETQDRIDWLFDNDKHDLADDMRPDCHKDGHTYRSVYGRLRMNMPAGTITQGFMTMGRGRFVHPSQRRTLTPHEGARIQGFPDWFRFSNATGSSLSRTLYQKLIGNAVPPAMGEPAILWALGFLPPDSVGPETAANA